MERTIIPVPSKRKMTRKCLEPIKTDSHRIQKAFLRSSRNIPSLKNIGPLSMVRAVSRYSKSAPESRSLISFPRGELTPCEESGLSRFPSIGKSTPLAARSLSCSIASLLAAAREAIHNNLGDDGGKICKSPRTHFPL